MLPLRGEKRCKHRQPLRLSDAERSLRIYGSWREGVLAVRRGLPGADRLLCFARKPPDPKLGPASSVQASCPAFLSALRWGRQDAAKSLLPAFVTVLRAEVHTRKVHLSGQQEQTTCPKSRLIVRMGWEACRKSWKLIAILFSTMVRIVTMRNKVGSIS